ncbi:MAG: ComEC/Rec2 family competence protein [Spirochaetales bacterium]|nr:ComEC/Rec2 family competence protein [Spirochaetales bacterium]
MQNKRSLLFLLAGLPLLFIWQAYGTAGYEKIAYTASLPNASPSAFTGRAYKDSVASQNGVFHFIELDAAESEGGMEYTVCGRIVILKKGTGDPSWWGQRLRADKVRSAGRTGIWQAESINEAGWDSRLLGARHTILSCLWDYMSRRDESGLLAALLLGKLEGFAIVYKGYMRECGASHLLALSGFHLGLLLQLVTLAAGKRSRRRGARIVMLIAVWLYHFVVGPIPSLTRAAMTLTCFSLMPGVSSPWKLRRSLVAGVLVSMWLFPELATDIGFRLSFFALFGIIAGTPFLAAWIRCILPGKTAQAVAACFCAQITTLGITMASFQTVPVTAFAYVLILTPLVTLYAFTGMGTLIWGRLSVILLPLRLCMVKVFDFAGMGITVKAEGIILTAVVTGCQVAVFYVLYKILRNCYGDQL